MLRSRRFQLLVVTVGAAAALIGYTALHSPSVPVPSEVDLAESSPIAIEAAMRVEDIALFERRSAEDPYGASDRARLATLFLQRARDTGSAGGG